VVEDIRRFGGWCDHRKDGVHRDPDGPRQLDGAAGHPERRAPVERAREFYAEYNQK
jgi:hypothetical protein